MSRAKTLSNLFVGFSFKNGDSEEERVISRIFSDATGDLYLNFEGDENIGHNFLDYLRHLNPLLNRIKEEKYQDSFLKQNYRIKGFYQSREGNFGVKIIYESGNLKREELCELLDDKISED